MAERHGDAALLAPLAPDQQEFRAPRTRGDVVPLVDRQGTCPIERRRPQRRTLGCPLQHSFQPAAPFMKVAADLPEPPQGHAETQPPLDIALCCLTPCQRRSQVVVLYL